MNPLNKCTIEGYQAEFIKELNKTPKPVDKDQWIHSDGTVGSSELISVVYAILNVLKTMQEKCKTTVTPDCTPAGYYNFVVKEVNPAKKIVDLIIDKYIATPLSSLAGCVALGIPAGIVGALKTPSAPYLGGMISAVQGCKTGLIAGPVFYNGYQIQLSMAENLSKGIDQFQNEQDSLVTPPPKTVANVSHSASKIEGMADLINQVGKALIKHSDRCSLEEQKPLSRTQEVSFSLNQNSFLRAVDSNEASEQIEPDNGFGPITDFLFAALDPMMTLSKTSRKVAKSICNIHPAFGDFCEALEVRLLKGLSNQRGRALVLTASSDFNGALNTERFDSWDNTKHSFHEIQYLTTLERFYDVTYKKISNLNSFCDAIDKEAIQNEKPDVLLVRAHGEQLAIQLNEEQFLTVLDELPLRSCLHNLAPNATIILHSCSSGEGKEHEGNFANYIARNSPKDVRIFASTIPHDKLTILKTNPLEIQFENTYRNEREITYKIDQNNKESAINVQPFTSDIPSSYKYDDVMEFGMKGLSTQSSHLKTHSDAPFLSRLLPQTEESAHSLSEFRKNIRLQWLRGQLSSQERKSNLEKKGQKTVEPDRSLTPLMAQLNPSLLHPKQSSMSVSTNSTGGTNGGVTLTPLNPKQTSLNISTPIPLLPQSSMGLHIVPCQIKESVLTTQFLSKEGEFGLETPLSKPLHSKVNVQFKFDHEFEIGAKISPHKPLDSQLSAQIPVTLYGIPFVVGCEVQLRHPENIKVKVGFPTFGLNKVTRKVGMSLPSTIPLLSISRQSICKTAKKIAKFFGFKKKKKKIEEEIIYIPSYYINSVIVKEIEHSIHELWLSYIELFRLLRNENIGSLEEIYSSQIKSNAQLSKSIHTLENSIQLESTQQLKLQMKQLSEKSIKLSESTSLLKHQMNQFNEINSDRKTIQEAMFETSSDLRETIKNKIMIEKQLQDKDVERTKTLSNCLAKLNRALPLLKQQIQKNK